MTPKGLRFRQAATFPFFRGTVRLRYANDQGNVLTRYIHFWQRTGQQVSPLLTLNLTP